ncbi:hypothetical protein [Methylobacterium mesophilicum]
MSPTTAAITSGRWTSSGIRCIAPSTPATSVALVQLAETTRTESSTCPSWI